MLEQVAELARRHNLIVFSDEIYDKLILDGTPHIAFASVAPDVPCVTFGGMSKNYLVPGWRIGWGIVSGDAAAVKTYTEGVHRLLRARLCANHPEQYAIKPALEGPQDHLIEVQRKLRSRRDLTQKWCEATPRVSCVAPRGAFYAYPRIDIPESDEIFVKELIRQKHVMVVHGSGFGQKPGTQHFRIVFLPDEKTLTKAYARHRGVHSGTVRKERLTAKAAKKGRKARREVQCFLRVLCGFSLRPLRLEAVLRRFPATRRGRSYQSLAPLGLCRSNLLKS